MLAEIFMLRLETQLRSAATNAIRTSSDTRFVPVTLAHRAEAADHGEGGKQAPVLAHHDYGSVRIGSTVDAAAAE